ncbi:MAG: DUF2946 domain-containing protein [Alphaproteobacteria bacterium]|nr:DUF2946 domain-containing protein [Alphaproteobacteria bacterium]
MSRVVRFRFTQRRRRQATAWLALLCLFASLLSGVANHLAPLSAATAVDAVEICSADGIKLVDPMTGEAPTKKSDHYHDHCLGCLAHQVSVGYLATTIVAFLPAAPALPVFAQDDAESRALSPPLLPQLSRAPPSQA